VSTAPGAFADLVTIGRVVKPQGRRGEVVVLPLSDRPGRFEELRRVFVPGAGAGATEMKVDSSWPHKGRVVLKLEGVDSIDAAERLRGLEVRIPEQDLETLPAGSYYHHELRGLHVLDEGGREIGAVDSVMTTGAGADVLVVKGPAGEALVPLVSSFVREVDLGRGRLVVVLPEMVDAAP
jgi:16S rRNA processing protein RimM